MRFILAVLLSWLAFAAARADILVNGSFADGRAHWRGDAQDVDAVNLGGMSSQSAGIVVKLKSDKWTKIYQTFNNRAPRLFFTVTAKVSDDYKLRGQDTSTPDFGDLPTDYMPWPMMESSWNLFVSGSGFFMTTKTLRPDARKAGPQTMTGMITDLKNVDEAVFAIFFPPGEGSITLLNVSLSATDPNAAPGN